MHFTNTLIIDRPVTETFAFISNFENMPAWNYFVEETTSESPPGGGAERYTGSGGGRMSSASS